MAASMSKFESCNNHSSVRFHRGLVCFCGQLPKPTNTNHAAPAAALQGALRALILLAPGLFPEQFTEEFLDFNPGDS